MYDKNIKLNRSRITYHNLLNPTNSYALPHWGEWNSYTYSLHCHQMQSELLQQRLILQKPIYIVNPLLFIFQSHGLAWPGGTHLWSAWQCTYVDDRWSRLSIGASMHAYMNLVWSIMSIGWDTYVRTILSLQPNEV
jgi:hypothetical protein